MSARFDYVASPDTPKGIKGAFLLLVNVLKGFTRDTSSGFVLDYDATFPTVGTGPVVTTPDGTKTYRLGVDNTGAVTSTLV